MGLEKKTHGYMVFSPLKKKHRPFCFTGAKKKKSNQKIALKNQTGIEEWIVKKVCDQNFYFLLKLCFNS